MFKPIQPTRALSGMLAILMLAVLAAACAPAAPSPEPTQPPAALPTETVPPPTATALPPTAVPSPTRVPATPTPAAAPTLGLGASGFKAWCMPNGFGIPPALAGTGTRPETAVEPALVNGKLQITIPTGPCTFTWNFNQPLPAGSELRIYDYQKRSVWLKAKLTPSAGAPATFFVTLNHSYIVNPPFWNVSYVFSVVTPDGVEKWSQELVFDKGWRSEKCWNNFLPNPVTLRCPKQQDPHPWDPWYHLATDVPED